MFGASPIPVGHRVEVFVLCRDVGVFGRDFKPQPTEPLVHDLSTGVWYGRTWHFDPNDAGLLEPRSPGPAPGTPVVERFSGVVAECVVVNQGQSPVDAATTLHLDVE